MTHASIDRIAPTLRPSGRVVMRQSWSHLLFLHWVLPAETLQALIPSGLEIDTFEGNAYIGLVPFTMIGVRPSWAFSVPGLSNFHEINVRTYVHRDGRDPGVWFFSLDAAQSIAVRIARSFWTLPYHFARMSLSHKEDGTVDYRSERLWPGPLPAACKMIYRPEGSPQASQPGTLEHFLAERYFLYAQGRRSLLRGQVHHTPYPLQNATVISLDESLVSASGFTKPNEEPLAHYASRVDVRIYALQTVTNGTIV